VLAPSPCATSVYLIIYFTPAFPGQCREGSSPRAPEIRANFQQPLVALLAPHQGGPSKVGYLIAAPDPRRPLDRFPLGVDSRNIIDNLSRSILITWPNNRSWDLSIWRSDSTFRSLRSSQKRTLSRSVRELFTKLPTLPLVFEIAFFQSLPMILGHM